MKPTTRGNRDEHAQSAPTIRSSGCAPGDCSGSANYRIEVHGHLDRHWSDWLDGLTLACGDGGHTVLTGRLRDQAALYGLLIKLRDLGLTLVSVARVEG